MLNSSAATRRRQLVVSALVGAFLFAVATPHAQAAPDSGEISILTKALFSPLLPYQFGQGPGYVASSNAPMMTLQSSGPVTIPIKPNNPTTPPVGGGDDSGTPPTPPAPVYPDPFVYALTGQDKDTYLQSVGGGTKEFPDNQIVCAKVLEQWAVISGPTPRGFDADGKQIWDFVGEGIVAFAGPHTPIPTRTYVNSYRMVDMSPSSILCDPGEVTASQTLILPAH